MSIWELLLLALGVNQLLKIFRSSFFSVQMAPLFDLIDRQVDDYV